MGAFMNRLFFAAIILMAASLSGPSFAADLPAQMPAKAPYSAPPVNWSGFYIGLNAGGAWSRADLGTSTIFDPANGADYFGDAASTNLFNSVGNQRAKASGFIGGAQAGFNWQVDNFVAGLETDFQSFHQYLLPSRSRFRRTGYGPYDRVLGLRPTAGSFMRQADLLSLN
jgi:outer membrane immunogenic protein